MNDTEYMRLALNLALKGKVSPNPLVGAVLIKNRKIIGKGYHQQAGKRHAEIVALAQAGKKSEGATLYVNLEPCATYGKTPPCVDRIIKEKVKKVVIALIDPNPVNRKKGIRKLRANNIDVKTGVLKKEAEQLNKSWIKFITQKQPYVILKIAQSLDGRIATFSGDSKWISSPAARQYVHKMRSKVDAILVGINTVIKDDPLLSARISENRLYKHQPIKIILDSHLRISPNAKVFSYKTTAGVIIATTKSVPLSKIKGLEKKGARVLIVKAKDKKIDLKVLMPKLAKMGIVRLLIEGGGEVFSSAVESRIVDEFFIFVAPKIIANVDKVSQAQQLSNLEVKRVGGDVLLKCSQV